VKVEQLEVLVEERSIADALAILLPKIVGDLSFTIYTHQGKQDLLAKLPERLRGYARFLGPETRILVVVDRDSQSCEGLKRTLETAAKSAGLATRSTAKGTAWQVVNRIAIEELEAWFFGDWRAVKAAYPKVPPNIPMQAAYRQPDQIAGGTSEALRRLLQAAGYFSGRPMSKPEVARAVAPHLDPRRNTSPSFHALRHVLEEVAALTPRAQHS
jgi:hypothetical protein